MAQVLTTDCNINLYLLRVVGLVVAELSLLLQDLVHLGGVRGGTVAAIRGRGGSGHGQNGGEHKLKTHSRYIIKFAALVRCQSNIFFVLTWSSLNYLKTKLVELLVQTFHVG